MTRADVNPEQLMNDARFQLDWQMNRCERLAIIWILEQIRPNLSLEVGTYKGGSLQVLAKYSRKVISIDSDPEIPSKLARFGNVEFLTGNSVEVLPRLIASLNESGETPEFILIDADHSTEGIKRDIRALLSLKPRRDIAILLHDSFNPDCRRGMTESNWMSSPYVHFVEIDFVPGSFNARSYDTAAAGSMWSGLAFALMKPGPRTGGLLVQESQKELYEAVKAISIHKADRGPSVPPVVCRIYLRSRIFAGRLKRRLLGQPIA
jgi:hypothetical protein